jgi:hypothetical protein
MARKPKRPDNNKRLAELEAKEAERFIATQPSMSFRSGQQARRAGLSAEQAPVFYSDAERDDWMAGYNG